MKITLLPAYNIYKTTRLILDYKHIFITITFTDTHPPLSDSLWGAVLFVDMESVALLKVIQL